MQKCPSWTQDSTLLTCSRFVTIFFSPKTFSNASIYDVSIPTFETSHVLPLETWNVFPTSLPALRYLKVLTRYQTLDMPAAFCFAPWI